MKDGELLETLSSNVKIDQERLEMQIDRSEKRIRMAFTR